MPTFIDLSNCACCNVCCPSAYANLQSYHVTYHFRWDDGTYDFACDVSWDSGESKWTGTCDCNGGDFILKFWCVSDNWYFDLISGGTNYAVPIANTTGGCTLVSCVPFQLFGQISSGFYGDDFPLCDKASPQFLYDFTFYATE